VSMRELDTVYEAEKSLLTVDRHDFLVLVQGHLKQTFRVSHAYRANHQ
jgi:hypothetical protein